MGANVEALEQLKRVVREVPDEQWEMSYFGEIGMFHGCGTKACIGGWAGVDSWFIQNTNILAGFDVKDDTGVMVMSAPDVLAEVFGIELRDAAELFAIGDGDCNNVSKEDVLANIDRLIAGLPAVPYGREPEVICG